MERPLASANGGRDSERSGLGGGPLPDAIRAQLGKILGSETFIHAGRLRRFLRFTVEEALQGHQDTLKEYEIGVQVFERGDSYDTRLDPIVRVEAGRLRSKLEEYYGAAGSQDSVLIEFQKGSYVPTFRERRPDASVAGRLLRGLRSVGQTRNVALAASALLAAAALIWAAVLFRESRSLRSEIEAGRPPRVGRDLVSIWGDFFTPGARNSVVFGSPIFFASQREALFLRWGGLTRATSSPRDRQYQAMEKRFGPLSEPRCDYTLTGDTLALHELTAFFGRAGVDLAAVPACHAAWEPISEGNIVFLGAPRMIPLLTRLPVQPDFEWDADHNVVNHKPRPGEQIKYATSSHYDATSYAIIAALPGLRPNRQILLLTAHSEPGVRAAVDYMTQPETAQELVQKLAAAAAAQRKYYQVLLRVFVARGSQIKSEYVTHHTISSP